MKNFNDMLNGYHSFRKKYAHSDQSVMNYLSDNGQKPSTMIIACCDSRVDPALILQCNPGDLFVVRNVANIVPPYEIDDAHHGTSAALEFGIRILKIQRLILLGHSQCGGIQTLLNTDRKQDDFITNWVSLIKLKQCDMHDPDGCAKAALHQSHQNCLTFPWIKEKVMQNELNIHLWFFDIKLGEILTYCEEEKKFLGLGMENI